MRVRARVGTDERSSDDVTPRSPWGGKEGVQGESTRAAEDI